MNYAVVHLGDNETARRLESCGNECDTRARKFQEYFDRAPLLPIAVKRQYPVEIFVSGGLQYLALFFDAFSNNSFFTILNIFVESNSIVFSIPLHRSGIIRRPLFEWSSKFTYVKLRVIY